MAERALGLLGDTDPCQALPMWLVVLSSLATLAHRKLECEAEIGSFILPDGR